MIGGQRCDPVGKSGLSAVTAECMRTGGIALPKISAARLDDFLEQKVQNTVVSKSQPFFSIFYVEIVTSLPILMEFGILLAYLARC